MFEECATTVTFHCFYGVDEDCEDHNEDHEEDEGGGDDNTHQA